MKAIIQRVKRLLTNKNFSLKTATKTLAKVTFEIFCNTAMKLKPRQYETTIKPKSNVMIESKSNAEILR